MSRNNKVEYMVAKMCIVLRHGCAVEVNHGFGTLKMIASEQEKV